MSALLGLLASLAIASRFQLLFAYSAAERWSEDRFQKVEFAAVAS